jgi:hypothetical protein
MVPDPEVGTPAELKTRVTGWSNSKAPLVLTAGMKMNSRENEEKRRELPED